MNAKTSRRFRRAGYQFKPGEVDKAELNRTIARNIMRQVDKKFTNPIGDKLIHWYNATGEYLGIGPEPPGNWSRNLSEAMQLLVPHNWNLCTCDMGYRCQIYTTPERGGEQIGDGVSDNVQEAICIAIIAAHHSDQAKCGHDKWRKSKPQPRHCPECGLQM